MCTYFKGLFDLLSLRFSLLGPSSALTLRDLSGYVRKAADFMESSAATAVKFSDEFGSYY